MSAEPVDIVLGQPGVGDRALSGLGHQAHGRFVGHAAALRQTGPTIATRFDGIPHVNHIGNDVYDRVE